MKAIIAIAAAVMSATAGAAQAQISSDPISVTISYADLDISKPSGRAVLERRVANAIDRVCPERPLPQELRQTQVDRACHRVAATRAQQQLAALYDGRQFAERALKVAGAN
ncbi:UrcA family protein [Phenylobacterium sp.]|uniref:UrcA family protein n=1 Tax=Phenylobacterium sp. TaxID=1871053 RepID=UPI003982E057